jgi:hypothetical protein
MSGWLPVFRHEEGAGFSDPRRDTIRAMLKTFLHRRCRLKSLGLEGRRPAPEKVFAALVGEFDKKWPPDTLRLVRAVPGQLGITVPAIQDQAIQYTPEACLAGARAYMADFGRLQEEVWTLSFWRGTQKRQRQARNQGSSHLVPFGDYDYRLGVRLDMAVEAMGVWLVRALASVGPTRSAAISAMLVLFPDKTHLTRPFWTYWSRGLAEWMPLCRNEAEFDQALEKAISCVSYMDVSDVLQSEKDYRAFLARPDFVRVLWARLGSCGGTDGLRLAQTPKLLAFFHNEVRPVEDGALASIMPDVMLEEHEHHLPALVRFLRSHHVSPAGDLSTYLPAQLSHRVPRTQWAALIENHIAEQKEVWGPHAESTLAREWEEAYRTETPAMFERHLRITGFFVQDTGNIDAVDTRNGGWSWLHQYSFENHTGGVSALLEWGADPLVKNHQGLLPVDVIGLARHAGHAGQGMGEWHEKDATLIRTLLEKAAFERTMPSPEESPAPPVLRRRHL